MLRNKSCDWSSLKQLIRSGLKWRRCTVNCTYCTLIIHVTIYIYWKTSLSLFFGFYIWLFFLLYQIIVFYLSTLDGIRKISLIIMGFIGFCCVTLLTSAVGLRNSKSHKLRKGMRAESFVHCLADLLPNHNHHSKNLHVCLLWINFQLSNLFTKRSAAS